MNESLWFIEKDFNSRFDYLRMEFKHKMNDLEEDYIEIRILKYPDSILSLGERMRR